MAEYTIFIESVPIYTFTTNQPITEGKFPVDDNVARTVREGIVIIPDSREQFIINYRDKAISMYYYDTSECFVHYPYKAWLRQGQIRKTHDQVKNAKLRGMWIK